MKLKRFRPDICRLVPGAGWNEHHGTPTDDAPLITEHDLSRARVDEKHLVDGVDMERDAVARRHPLEQHGQFLDEAPIGSPRVDDDCQAGVQPVIVRVAFDQRDVGAAVDDSHGLIARRRQPAAQTGD